MEKGRSHTTERILNLTLEIIYLLTGEDYGPIKSNDPPPPFPTLDRNNAKILEVTQKIIELLTGEVPIRCQDVTVYFSMEEWEYIEGHKDLYKDVMMEKRPPLTSPDGSSNGNPPERCPRPLYSQDSAQDNWLDGTQCLTKIHHVKESGNRITVKVKEEADEPYVRGDDLCKKEEIPPEISTDGSSNGNPPERCPRPLYSRDSTQEDQEIPQEDQCGYLITVKAEVKEEAEKPYVMVDGLCKEDEVHPEIPPEISTDGSSNGNPPERCPRPLYSRDSTQEHQEIPQEDQSDDFTVIKIEDEEEMSARGGEPCKKEEIPPEISTDGSSNRNPPERCPRPLYSRDSTQERQEIPQEDPSNDFTVITVEDEEEMSILGDEVCKVEEIPPKISKDSRDTRTAQKDLKSKEKKGGHVRIKGVEVPPEISTDGTSRNNLAKCPVISLDSEMEDTDITSDSSDYDSITPQRHSVLPSADLSSDPSTHGAIISDRSSAVTNHTSYGEGEILQCSEAGENVTQEGNFVKKETNDTGQKENPFSCPECGKCFALRSSLTRHQRAHTGTKPYVCPKCGKRFLLRSYLTSHQKVHSGEKPYSCPECGKCFAVKSGFTRHQKVHSAERPFCCSQCGKCFQWKSSLDYHRKTHDVEKPFACQQCGKSFQWRTFLDFHMHTHTNEKPISS